MTGDAEMVEDACRMTRIDVERPVSFCEDGSSWQYVDEDGQLIRAWSGAGLFKVDSDDGRAADGDVRRAVKE